MKKSIHRLLTVFLVAMMVSSVALQVNAAEVGSSPSISPRVPANQTQLFFMNITEVKSIKTTIGDPEKMFLPRNLPSNVTLYLGGCLNHDLNGYYIRSGIIILLLTVKCMVSVLLLKMVTSSLVLSDAKTWRKIRRIMALYET